MEKSKRDISGQKALPDQYILPTATSSVLKDHLARYIRIRAYMNRFTTLLPPMMEHSEIAFGLFDPEGYLLKLFSNERVSHRLKTCGITIGTIWTRELIGENAIGRGLEEKVQTSSVGEENDCCFLKPFALYYAPILGGEEKGAAPILYGGLALIVPAELHNPDYNVVVYSATNDISMHMHLCELYYRTLETWLGALLVFDINKKNGNLTTVYHSANIFETLNIAPVDIYFQPATSMIDPLPANKEFWDIIAEHKEVKDYNIQFTLHGRTCNCIVSTLYYHLPQLGIQGIKFLITTPQLRSAEISKRITNNAVRSFENIIGDSSALKKAIQTGQAIARSDSNIMILGESGVGKDIFAQAIHNAGKRKNKPFVAINCGALPRDLIASELFGYDEGAFTGAKRQGNMGKFELANGGTLFLDEIGELPMDLQASLLRAVEQKKITRLGGSREIEVDVRIISATNADIKALIAQKKFRSDLYYRLNTLRLIIPPLRERGDDAVLLAEYFIDSITTRIGRAQRMKLAEDAKEPIRRFSWPGNIRQLQNVIESVVQLCDGDTIHGQDILENIDAEELTGKNRTITTKRKTSPARRGYMPTKEEIEQALKRCGGNRSKAAEELGIARRTLYNYISKYEIS